MILHDRLVGKDILALARREARLIPVGKQAGRHSVAQDRINEQLLAHARAGLRVVRLKGGDPLVFGRGGEEMVYLRRHGVEVRVVPCVTAALGCAANLGLPVTFRGLARRLTFVTAHCQGEEMPFDWPALAEPRATLAVYMGRSNAGRMSRELIAAGLPPDTPAVAVEDATLPGERYRFATLRELPQAVAEFSADRPLLLLIGQAVALAGAEVRVADQPAAAAA